MVFVPAIMMAVVMRIPASVLSVIAIRTVIARYPMAAVDPVSRHPDRACIISRYPEIPGPRAGRSICRNRNHRSAYLH